ncbi:MAG TPA: hypothetical protein PLG24_01900, partial [Saprospiraceae bacterium]|nr:hypothetical protein [Saprospiraceae bacterium]
MMDKFYSIRSNAGGGKAATFRNATTFINHRGALGISLILGLFLTLSSCASLNKSLAVSSMKDVDYGMPVKYAHLSNDIEMAYSESGSGPQTILFIHGLASYIPAWKKNIVSLKDHYRCI